MARRTRCLAGTVACVVASLHPYVIASAADTDAERREYDLQIERQPLAHALQEFARQSGVHVIFFSSITEGQEAPPLHGRFTTKAALEQLLYDTLLTFREIHPNTIKICLRSSTQCAPATTQEPPQSITETDMQNKPTKPASPSGPGGSMKSDAFVAALLAGTGALALSPMARAQSNDGKAADVLQEVVVTGSRVISNGNNSPTPLTVISTEKLLETQPTTVAAALQNIPVFQGSLGQTTGTGGAQAAGPNGSANAVNIRNLGLNRTLVLVDGSRLQPTTDTGVVTLDMIPEMLLQRVDVVTGGASAVYGSDAISGVVNFVTDKKFNGMKFKAQSGISELGDGAINSIGIALGSNVLSGRGHIEGSYEYYDDEGIFDMFSRDVGNNYMLAGANVGSTAPPGTAANPYKLYSNVHISTSSFGGLIRSGPLAGQNFTTNGVLSSFQNGAATGTNGFQVGGDGAYNFNSSLKGALRSNRALVRFDYDLTDTTHFYFQSLGAKYRNKFNNYSLPFDNVTLSTTNAFLPANYQAAMQSVTTFTLSQIPQQKEAHTNIWEMESYQLISGLNGRLGNYTWDASYSHGYSQPTWNILHNPNFLKQAAALDAVRNPANGQIVCRVTLTNPAAFPGCAPLNLFGPTAASPEALDYYTDHSVASTTQSQDEVNASITGAPFSTWAGPVNIAVSGEWRQAYYRTDSDSKPEDLANCALLPNTMNCTATTALHRVTFRSSTPVMQTVSEAALEADLPLLKDAPLAQSLNVNLAGRYASYSEIGSAPTWKIGLDWHLNDEWRFRATRSRDFRAPNLNNLYSPASVARTNVRDELTGAQLFSVPTQTGGNPNLKPEVGDTLTAGIIYIPNWLPGLSLSVDAYDIEITDALTIVNGTNTTVQRQCNASGGSSPYCELIVRPFPMTDTSTANNATYFYNRNINAASITSHGLDIETNYATHMFQRPFSLRVLATWQPELRTVIPALSDIDEAGSATTPEWRLTAFLDYSLTDRFRVGLSERWRSGVTWNADPALFYAEPKVPTFSWTNLNMTYSADVKHMQMDIYFNIQNLFNNQPPAWTSSTNNPGLFGAYVRTDDFVGRYYTLGVRLRL